MKKHFFITLIFLAITFYSCLAQQLPGTTLGRLTGQMIRSINSNDKQTQLAFINSNMSKDALRSGAESWLKDFSYFNTGIGKLDLVVVSPSSDTTRINIVLHSKRNHWIRLITILSKNEPLKLDGYGYGITEDPAIAKAYEWPHKVINAGAIIKEIDRHEAHLTSIDQFSGVVLVAKNDRVVFDKACGLADKTFNVHIDTATRFNIGSMNKMFTSVAIGQLIQAGKLNFNDTLAKILPDYPNQAIAKKITIAQLLTHTSGLGDFFKDEFFEHLDKYITLKSYLPIFQNDTLKFKPGTKYSYSNAGFIVLGLVIEKVSGEDYFDYIRRHIYQPAGMHHTDSYKRDSIVTNLATGYMWPDGFDPLHLNPRIMNWGTLPLKGSSAGGGYATAGDLLRFSIALKNHTLLNAGLTDTLLNGKVFVGNRDGVNFSYAYGFDDFIMKGKHIAGHGGGAPGLNAAFRFFRDGSYTVIVLSNYDAPSANILSQQIVSFLLDQ